MTDNAENQSRSTGSGNLISFTSQREVNSSQASVQPTEFQSFNRASSQRVVIQTSNAQVAARTSPPSQIMFDRRELNEILRVYGFKVASGEWRDYAIDHLKDRAVFSVFRKSSEIAMFRIEKSLKLARKQGAYSVVTMAGVVLKRGSDLSQVLRVFDKKTKLRVL